MLTDHEGGYSADVDIRLEVNGTVLSVAQVGRDSLILMKPYAVPLASNARIVITVDGREHPHDVVLHSQDARRVNFG